MDHVIKYIVIIFMYLMYLSSKIKIRTSTTADVFISRFLSTYLHDGEPVMMLVPTQRSPDAVFVFL